MKYGFWGTVFSYLLAIAVIVGISWGRISFLFPPALWCTLIIFAVCFFVCSLIAVHIVFCGKVRKAFWYIIFTVLISGVTLVLLPLLRVLLGGAAPAVAAALPAAAFGTYLIAERINLGGNTLKTVFARGASEAALLCSIYRRAFSAYLRSSCEIIFFICVLYMVSMAVCGVQQPLKDVPSYAFWTVCLGLAGVLAAELVYPEGKEHTEI